MSNRVQTLTVGSMCASRARNSPDVTRLSPGEKVGEYEIRRHLADGGMASVYEAVHPVISKRVAVKVLNGALGRDERILERFVREARAVNEIDHPNIVDIFAFGQLSDRRHYLVMELLVGDTLAERLCQGALEPSFAYEILGQICDALDATHAHHIAHLDLKPENIFLVQTRGGPPQVKLLDFGIAELIDPEADPNRAHPNHVFRGTPEYASPEQARDLPELDHRSDIYSLGVLAFEMLVGRRPFRADTPIALLSKHVTQAPPRPGELGVELPRDVEALLLRMLAKLPEDRPTADQVRTTLASLRARDEQPATSAQVIAPPPPSVTMQLAIPRNPMYRRTAAALGAAAAVLVSLGLGFDWSHGSSGTPLEAARAVQPQSLPAASPPVPRRAADPRPAPLATTVAIAPSRPAKSHIRSERRPSRGRRELAQREPRIALDYLLDYVGDRR